MFITLEGPEGAGKSTVATSLTASLQQAGFQVLTTREPGAALDGEIRALLLNGPNLHPLCEVFLFLADRAQHVSQVIRPALKRGEVVICDRYFDSTIVYQGYARGLDIEWLRQLNLAATENLIPNLTLLLDMPVEVGMARGLKGDRIDNETLEFHERVRLGFLTESVRESRWRVINADRDAEVVAADALSAVLERIKDQC